MAGTTRYGQQSVIHKGYPQSKDETINVAIKDIAGNTVTLYEPGKKYSVLVNFVTPMNLIGAAGFLMGATAQLGKVGGGDLAFVGATALGQTAVQTKWGKVLTCPGLNNHITHTLDVFNSFEIDQGVVSITATWTAPLTPVGDVALQVGLITGADDDPTQGAMVTVTIQDPITVAAAAKLLAQKTASNNAYMFTTVLILIGVILYTIYEAFEIVIHGACARKEKKTAVSSYEQTQRAKRIMSE